VGVNGFTVSGNNGPNSNYSRVPKEGSQRGSFRGKVCPFIPTKFWATFGVLTRYFSEPGDFSLGMTLFFFGGRLRITRVSPNRGGALNFRVWELGATGAISTPRAISGRRERGYFFSRGNPPAPGGRVFFNRRAQYLWGEGHHL